MLLCDAELSETGAADAYSQRPGDIVQVPTGRSLFMIRVGNFIPTFHDKTDTQLVDLTLREINGGHR